MCSGQRHSLRSRVAQPCPAASPGRHAYDSLGLSPLMAPLLSSGEPKGLRPFPSRGQNFPKGAALLPARSQRGRAEPAACARSRIEAPRAATGQAARTRGLRVAALVAGQGRGSASGFPRRQAPSPAPRHTQPKPAVGRTAVDAGPGGDAGRRPPYQTAGRVPSSRQRTETVAAARGEDGQDPSIAARVPSMPETRTPQNIPRKAWHRSLEGGRFARACCHPSPPRTHACRNQRVAANALS